MSGVDPGLERLMRAWDKAGRIARLDFLTFLDQWQAMRRDEVEQQKAALAADRSKR